MLMIHVAVKVVRQVSPDKKKSCCLISDFGGWLCCEGGYLINGEIVLVEEGKYRGKSRGVGDQYERRTRPR